MKDYRKLAMVLLGMTLVSGVAQANSNVFYTYCGASINYETKESVVSPVFRFDTKVYTYDSDVNRSFTSYIRKTYGTVDYIFCKNNKSQQNAEIERNKDVQNIKNLGRIINTIQWSYRGD